MCSTTNEFRVIYVKLKVMCIQSYGCIYFWEAHGTSSKGNWPSNHTFCSAVCNSLGYTAFWIWTHGCYCSNTSNPLITSDPNHSVCNRTCIVNCTGSNCEYCGDTVTSYVSFYNISM